MGKLTELIIEAKKDKCLQQRNYGRFPFEISEQCGLEEVKDILQKLQELAEERKNIEEWDGDSQDDIGRAQMNFSELLQLLITRYPKEIALGLKIQNQEARYWVAAAFEKSPSSLVIVELAEYLLNEMSDAHRKSGESALKACKAKKSIFSRRF
jgi:hypothetical protein